MLFSVGINSLRIGFKKPDQFRRRFFFNLFGDLPETNGSLMDIKRECIPAEKFCKPAFSGNLRTSEADSDASTEPAASAMKNKITGTQMPSFNPLSTFMVPTVGSRAVWPVVRRALLLS